MCPPFVVASATYFESVSGEKLRTIDKMEEEYSLSKKS